MGKNAATREEARGIEDTLSDLEIDKDAAPEDAATDAAQETTGTVVADPPPEQPPDDEGDEGEDEDDDADGDVAVVIPPPKSGKPLPEAPPEPALVPPPRAARPRTRANAPGAAKLGKGLADKVPGAEKVKVYKREKDGKKWFVSEYTKADLAESSDFESFLTEYVKEEHGAGEYILVGVDAMNREMELGVVRLRAVAKPATDGALSVLQTMIAQNQKRDAEYLERMKETMQPQPQIDPLSLLTGVMALKKEMEGDGANAASQASSSMGAMMEMLSTSGDKTMQMMMMMMQQQQAAAQQQQNMMMQMFAKPKEEDPVMKMLMLKLFEDKSDSGGGGGLPMPAPPPPTADPLDGITKLLGVLLPVFAGGDGGGEDDFKEFLKQQHATSTANSLGIKDVLELVNGAKGDAKTGGEALKESADNLALVMNIANNMNRQTEGGPAAGLFDALAALFSNRDFAGSIAQTIRQKTGGGAPQLPANITPEQRQALLQRAAAVQQQRAALAAAGAIPGGQMPPGALPPGYVMTPAGPVLAQQGGPPVAPTAQPVATPVAPPTETQQRAADQEIARTRKLPELPANTYEHVNNLANAPDEGALVGATVTMLIYFAEFEDWRQFSEMTLGLARDGNKAGTLEYLKAFFEGLAEIHMIDPTLSKKILGSIDAHFEVLQAQLSDIGLEGDGDVTGESLLSDEGGDEGDTEDPGGDDEENDDGGGAGHDGPTLIPEPPT